MTTDTQDLLQRAFADGHLQLITSGKTEKIRYVAVNVSEKWSDPEEKVRAAYYAELIYRYGYAPECIGIEVTVPDRTPVDRADLVVFRDKERTKPFGVIECKRDGVSDTEFKQAVEQAFGNGHAHKFRAEYNGVIAGQTRDEKTPRRKGDPYEFQIKTNETPQRLATRIERPRDFLEAAQLSADWVREMSEQALILEAHHTTHIEDTRRTLDQAERL